MDLEFKGEGMRNKGVFQKVLAMLVAAVIVLSNSMMASAAAKLSEEDFVAELSSGSETYYFFAELDEIEADSGFRVFLYDKNYDKSKKSVITTARGINIGSKEATVIKKYGKGTVGKLSKDIAYKEVLEISKDYKAYFKTVTSVRTYKFVEKLESGASYTSRIHFYIDKNGKVVSCGFTRTFKNN